jgi:hypothetical protein
VVAPQIPGFKTMQERWPWQEDLPKDSRWGRNNKVPGNWK